MRRGDVRGGWLAPEVLNGWSVMVERYDVVQRVLRLFPAPTYLEIGVDAGHTFHAVAAARKVAVDPKLSYAPPVPNPMVDYHAVTSDQYFGAVCPPDLVFDVVYIDGLHTFEQTMRDLMNAVLRLTRQGVIILDDVLPRSFHASMPSIEQAFAVRDFLSPGEAANPDNTWMGDVYKLVFFIDAFIQQMSFATVLENHGQLLLWRSRRPAAALGRRTVRDIALLDFADTILQRDLFRLRKLDDIVADIVRSRQS